MSIHLDEFEAIYGVSDNINELRNKILDLAFKGKLTKQNNSIDYSKNNLNNSSLFEAHYFRNKID